MRTPATPGPNGCMRDLSHTETASGPSRPPSCAGPCRRQGRSSSRALHLDPGRGPASIANTRSQPPARPHHGVQTLLPLDRTRPHGCGGVWSPPPESNRRPLPYHGTRLKRCAGQGTCSLTATVNRQGKWSSHPAPRPRRGRRGPDARRGRWRGGPRHDRLLREDAAARRMWPAGRTASVRAWSAERHWPHGWSGGTRPLRTWS
jgi:hypothetical protein